MDFETIVTRLHTVGITSIDLMGSHLTADTRKKLVSSPIVKITAWDGTRHRQYEEWGEAIFSNRPDGGYVRLALANRIA